MGKTLFIVPWMRISLRVRGRHSCPLMSLSVGPNLSGRSMAAENVNQMTAGPRRPAPSHASYFVNSPALFSLQSLKQI